MKPHEWFVEHRTEYASRTLDAGDERTFKAHLVRCEECRREVAEIEADLEWLPMALTPATPSPDFKRRVIEGVLEGGRSRGGRWLVPAALAASAVLALGGWLLGRSGNGALQRELAEQRAAVAALEDTLSIMRQAERVLQANVEVGDARGGVLIFAEEATHRWNVVIHGLPPAAAGHRYQFWFICKDGKDSMVRGAAVVVDSLKPTMFTTGMPEPQSCPAVMGAALTEEPMTEDQGPPRGKALAHLML